MTQAQNNSTTDTATPAVITERIELPISILGADGKLPIRGIQMVLSVDRYSGAVLSARQEP